MFRLQKIRKNTEAMSATLKAVLEELRSIRRVLEDKNAGKKETPQVFCERHPRD